VFGHVNLSTYYRILVPRLLPDAAKVIYLDADMLVLGDLGELWKMSMEGQPLMAVQDGSATILSARIPGRADLNLRSEARVLNGGLLVMDLGAWRREGLTERMLVYSRRYANEVQFWDQDGINAMLADRWVVLPSAWNWRVDCGLPTEPTGLDPGRPEARARVLHFSSSIKPWHYYCDHEGKKWFFAYVDRTPLRGWRPRAPLRALLNRHYWGAWLRRMPGVGRLLGSRSSQG